MVGKKKARRRVGDEARKMANKQKEEKEEFAQKVLFVFRLSRLSSVVPHPLTPFLRVALSPCSDGDAAGQGWQCMREESRSPSCPEVGICLLCSALLCSGCLAGCLSVWLFGCGGLLGGAD